MARRHVVCPASNLPPGERRVVEVDGLSVGVFNLEGEYYALNNACPHQLAPLCEGDLTGLVTSDSTDPEEYEWDRDGEIITCPWHNWEFDITTGESVFNPHKVRTRTYDVTVEEVPVDDDTEDAGEADDPAAVDSNSAAGETDEQREYGTELAGDEPPVETYDVAVEDEMVVLYV